MNATTTLPTDPLFSRCATCQHALQCETQAECLNELHPAPPPSSACAEAHAILDADSAGQPPDGLAPKTCSARFAKTGDNVEWWNHDRRGIRVIRGVVVGDSNTRNTHIRVKTEKGIREVYRTKARIMANDKV